jgi:hypothetical protein
MNGGVGCNSALAEVAPCNDDPVCHAVGEKVDCVLSSWEAWTECSKSCGGGEKSRKRTIQTPAKNGGEGCVGTVAESAACNEQVCDGGCDKDVDCVWGTWAEWSVCSVSCAGGERTRYRSILTAGLNMGKQCEPGDSREVGECNKQACGVERFCTWSSWSSYSECSAKCGPGTKTRTRELQVVSTKPAAPLDSSILAAMTDPVGEKPSYSRNVVASSAGFAAVVAMSAMLKRRPRYAVAPSSEAD